jgi:hypothetical protein
MNRTAALLCLLLTACATPPQPPPFAGWTHPTHDTAQFERDRDQCVYETEKAVAGYSPGYVPPTPYGAALESSRRTDLLERKIGVLTACLRARGYYERGER